MRYITSIGQMIRTEVKEEGREEKRRELALKMVQENIDTETIARITGMSIAEVQQLISQQ